MINALLLVAVMQATAAPQQAAPAELMTSLTTPRALVQLSALTGTDYTADAATTQGGDAARVAVGDEARAVESASGAAPYAAATARIAETAAVWAASARTAMQQGIEGAKPAANRALAATRAAGRSAWPVITRAAVSPYTHAAIAVFALLAGCAFVMRRRRQRPSAQDAALNVRAARELMRGGAGVDEVARRTGLPRDAAALLELRRRPEGITATRERQDARRAAAAPANTRPRPQERPVMARTIEQRPRTAATARRPAARPALELAPTRTGARHRFAIEGRTT